MHLFIPKNDSWKNHLIEEMQRNDKVLGEEIVSSPDGLAVELHLEQIDWSGFHLGFSLDFLPNVLTLKEDSIGKQANEIIELIEKEAIAEEIKQKPLDLQIFSLSKDKGILTTGRSQLIEEKLHKLFRKNKIRRSKEYCADLPLLKVAIMPNRELRISMIPMQMRNLVDHLLSPFPGGFTTISDDKLAPSRAYRKIIESQKVLGKSILKEEKLLDLGASPGGWSYRALKKGALVTAVDRSPLREDLMQDKKLSFFEADAFSFKVDGKLDWVISDIICLPRRILELIDQWVVTEKCEQFIFTIKFKATEDYPILEEFKSKLVKLPYRCILRQLNSNKNEVMVMGRRS